MARTMVCCILVTLLTGWARIAAQESKPKFDVASVKRQTQFLPGNGRQTITSETLFYRRADTISQLMRFAYAVSAPQLIGGPEWIRTFQFEVDARSASRASAEQMRLMVQSLLEDRFKLRAYKEQRDMPYAGIVVARSDGRLGPNLQKCDVGKVTDHSPFFVIPRGGDTKAEVCGPLSTLASAATSVLREVAIDRTGLTGTWAWHVSYLDAAAAQRLPTGVVPQAVEFPTALQEQLGLKLSAMEGPVEVVIIDSVQQPTDN
jgi:uncharacterized protein (TIGR03435 family)